MDKADIKSGDLVKLKSGSPTMTVSHFSGTTNRAVCVWFDDPVKGQPHTLECSPLALKKLEE